MQALCVKNKMKIYWFLKNIPEFKGMNKSEINKIWFPCYMKTFRLWQQWVATIIILLFIFSPSFSNSMPLIPMLIFAGFLGLAWSQFSIFLARSYIREALNENKNT